MNGSVAYILMGFPRVPETFIASEIHRVEQAGVPLKLFVIKPVEAREQGHDHPVLDAIVAQPEYLPDPVTENGRATVRERFDGERLAADLAALFRAAIGQ